MLEEERLKASFDVAKMTNILVSIPPLSQPKLTLCRVGSGANPFPNLRLSNCIFIFINVKSERIVGLQDGGEEYTGKRRWIENSHKDAQAFVHAELPRDEQVRHSIKHFMDVHKAHLGSYKPKDMDMSFMSNARMTRCV